MDKVILFKNTEGGVTIIVPSPEALRKYAIEQIAEKDVPEGSPYKIINRSELPSDRAFRDAWDIDDSELTDGVGGSITSFDPVEN
jgi:hypothetical protein